MIRKLMGAEIRQEHLTGFFSVNDLTLLANIYRKNKGLSSARWDNYINSEKSKEFFTSLMQKENLAQIIKSTRGRYASTWCHPLVFFDYAMWLSPDFKVEIYKWLMDNLIIFRDKSGESYKLLATQMQKYYNMKPSILGIELPQLAREIKEHLKVSDWNIASEKELQQRDKIHNDISLLMKASVPLAKIKSIVLDMK